MPHVHTGKGQHDHTVTAYVIRLDQSKPLALLHMHRKLDKLLPIGGHIELEETPWQAMEHEIEEESGYSFDELTLLQPVSRLKTMSDADMHPYPVAINTHKITDEHSHTDISYCFIANNLPSGIVDSTESTDFRWLTQPELNEINIPDIHLNTKEVYNFIFDECLEKWERVKPTSFES